MATNRKIKIKYPTYSITAPQTGEHFEVRSLVTSEARSIAESVPNITGKYNELNEIIWNCVTHSPKRIKTFEDFKKNVTVRDREALIYGIYMMTFEKIKDYKLKCMYCGTENDQSIDLEKNFNIEIYPYSESCKTSYSVNKIKNKQEDELMEYVMREEGTYPQIDGVENPPEGMPEKIARDQHNEYFKILDEKTEEYIEDYKKQQDEKIEELDDYDPLEEGENEEKEQKQKNKKGPGRPKKEENVKQEEVPEKSEKPEKDYNILTRVDKLNLPVSGLTVYIRSPKISDEEDFTNNLAHLEEETMTSAIETIMIDSIDYEDEDTEEIEKITDRVEIYEVYEQMLPIKDKDTIVEYQWEQFGKYGISLNKEWLCSNSECKQTNIFHQDIMRLFFRSIFESTY